MIPMTTKAPAVNIYARVSAEDIATVDHAAETHKPLPVSRSMMIAMIIREWGDRKREEATKR